MEEIVKLVDLDPNNQDHLRLMYDVRKHPDVAKQLCKPPPENFSRHVQYLQEAVKGGTKKFFIICFHENICGYCHVTDGISSHDTLELGWALHPDWWGKGIGKRSVSLLLQILKDSGLSQGKTLTLLVKKDNVKAVSIYKKSGFVILSENENQEYLMHYHPEKS